MSIEPVPRAEPTVGAEDLAERRQILLGYEILGSAPEPTWDSLARVAAALVEMPTVLVSWYDGARLWFKARVGFDLDSLPLQGTMCSRTLLTNATTVFADLEREPEFVSSHVVRELGARSYVGVPIHAPGRAVAIGVLCAVDYEPRTLAPDKIAALEGLARQAEALLELRLEKRRIEKARRAQVVERKRLEATLDAAAVGFFVTRVAEREDYGNRALERILGRSASELAQGWHNIVHPDDLSIPARWQESALAQPPRPMDYRIRMPAGGVRWVRNHMAPIHDGEALAGWVGTIADITELKQLEAQLRATEERLEFAIAVGEHGIWDWDLVTDAVVYSDSWYQLFDVPKESQPSHVDVWRARVHPDDLPRCLAAQQAHIRDGTNLYEVEYRFRKRDEWRWIFGRGRVVARAPDGRALRFVGTNMDITKRRQVEEAVRLAHARLLQAETIADLGHWTSQADDESSLTWSPNMYRIFRRDPALGPPRQAEAVLAMLPEDRERMRLEVAEALREGRDWSVEYRVHGDRGEIRYHHSRGRRRVEPDGEVFFDGTEQDVTEVVRVREALRNAKDAAEVASRAKAEFLATMSHEIRTPLNGVLGMAELLRDTELTPEQRAFVDVARASGEWLLALVSDVLDFSKIDADHIDLAPQPFCIRTLMDDVAGVVAEAAQRKGLELWVDAGPEVPALLLGDTQRIRQILLNLAANAVKFTDQGEVELKVACVVDGATARLVLSVRDTGPGIAPEQQAQVFEPFVQGGPKAGRKQSGTGLGLAIAQRLAGHMHGHITVDSALGVGARFSLMLPLPITTCAETASSVPRGLRVAVVNGHPAAAHALARWLTQGGAVVSVSHDLATGEAALAESEIAIIDTNVHDDVHELAQRVRRTRGIPLVLATAVAERQFVPPNLFASLLVKPIRQQTLFDILTQLASPPARTGSAPRPRPNKVRFEGARVLIAEDNRINSFLLRAMLERLGCRVDVVEDGSSAFVAVSEQRYDVVFMDCIMADMDGYAATARIRAGERDAHVPIVAVTASAIEGDRERCLAAGMDDYLTKPITNDAIMAALQRWIR